jgi:serine/threonine protein kinase
MTLPTGTRLARYTIRSRIGAGGMGEVYRATDALLSREIALKVLPSRFVTNPLRLARSTRKACKSQWLKAFFCVGLDETYSLFGG